MKKLIRKAHRLLAKTIGRHVPGDGTTGGNDRSKASKRGESILQFTNHDDSFLVSYPKSGNTWMRFLLGNLLYPNDEPVSFLDIDNKVPQLPRVSTEDFARLPPPRTLKSHNLFDPRYGRVIYMVRHPKSVAVSYYHHLIRIRAIHHGTLFCDYMDGFIKGIYNSEFGNWAENVLGWLRGKGNDRDFLLIKYEDLKSDTLGELERVAYFLGLEVETSSLERAIRVGAFEQMRKMEVSQKRKAELFRKNRRNTFFVRTGKTDEWRDYFDEQCDRLVQDNFKEAMAPLGYV